MLCRVALVRTDTSEERIASVIRATRIWELGTTLAAISYRNILRRNTIWRGSISKRYKRKGGGKGWGKQVVAWVFSEMLNGPTTKRDFVASEEGEVVYSKQSMG
jgi:hypothetical protein